MLFLCITESWANKNAPDSEINLIGYDLFHKDRGGNCRGGGVLLHVNSSLNAVEYTLSEFSEQVWCHMKDNKGGDLIHWSMLLSTNRKHVWKKRSIFLFS